jgi:phosphomannomutase
VQFPIFGISGLRGITGKDLFPETVSAVAAAFGSMAGPGQFALGRDARLSGEMFYSAAAAGLISAGCEVVGLGVCATPTVLHHVRTNHTAGGIVITASHNPDKWNGMKFVSREGVFIAPEQVVELKRLAAAGEGRRAQWKDLRLVRSDPNAVVVHVNAITGSDLFDDVREKLSARKVKVGIDAVNGAASVAAVQLVQALGAVPVELYCRTDDETIRKGFPRRPEPAPENLADLCRIVRQANLDAGLAFDPDGDRFSCVDETGTALGEELTICLAARYLLGRRKGPVVVNLSTTRAIDDVCAEQGITVERTAVGEAAVVAKMRELKAVLGGEGNGGVIVPEVNFTRDGLVAAAAVLGLIAETGKKLSEIRASLPEYHTVKLKLESGRKDIDARLGRFAQDLGEAQADRTDGLKLVGPDWWIHVRPSNTEPVVRIIAEAKTKEQAHALAQKAQKALAG